MGSIFGEMYHHKTITPSFVRTWLITNWMEREREGLKRYESRKNTPKLSCLSSAQLASQRLQTSAAAEAKQPAPCLTTLMIGGKQFSSPLIWLLFLDSLAELRQPSGAHYLQTLGKHVAVQALAKLTGAIKRFACILAGFSKFFKLEISESWKHQSLPFRRRFGH